MSKEEFEKGENLSALFLRMTHVYFKRVYLQTAEFGIHPGQLPMIKLLAHNPGLSQREIATALHIKPPTVTVTLKRLEKADIIHRKADKKDLRIVRIYLSEKGEEINKSIRRLVDNNEDYLSEGYSEAELYLFKRFLKQFIRNAEKIPSDPELINKQEEFK